MTLGANRGHCVLLIEHAVYNSHFLAFGHYGEVSDDVCHVGCEKQFRCSLAMRSRAIKANQSVITTLHKREASHHTNGTVTQ